MAGLTPNDGVPVASTQQAKQNLRPSLRAKRSNPEQGQTPQFWIASSASLLAMTNAKTTIPEKKT